MSFFEGLGRLIRGKPIFIDKPKDSDDDYSDDPWKNDEPAVKESTPAEKSFLFDEKGRKIIPEIRFEHCKSHINGDDMMVTVWATNTSDLEVEIDKVDMLGVRREIDRFLKPQEAHEILLYKGKIPTDENGHRAILQYKIVENGDCFAAEFRIEYNFESDRRYTVEELHPEPVVRDI